MNSVNKKWVCALIVSSIIIMHVTCSPGTKKKGINVIPFKENKVFIRAFFSNTSMTRHEIPLWVFLNLFGNVGLFIPFGFFLAGFLCQSSSRSPYVIAILSGCMLSFFIEFLQLFMPTRATDIDDIMLNTVGTCLGVMLFHIFKKLSTFYKRRSHLMTLKEYNKLR